MRKRLSAAALALALTACAKSGAELRKEAQARAGGAGLSSITLSVPPYELQGFERITQASLPVRVYIEGDGNAWLTRSQPSPDPTPFVPVALQLALRDPSANVAYIARPCQYITGPACDIPVWT
ncbi:MAG: hypothetical protein K2Q01_04500, partial [Rickettsiales bacterium]|nr:hypothetical protein [Rickettsiales bacterium]